MLISHVYSPPSFPPLQACGGKQTGPGHFRSDSGKNARLSFGIQVNISSFGVNCMVVSLSPDAVPTECMSFCLVDLNRPLLSDLHRTPHSGSESSWNPWLCPLKVVCLLFLLSLPPSPFPSLPSSLLHDGL